MFSYIDLLAAALFLSFSQVSGYDLQRPSWSGTHISVEPSLHAPVYQLWSSDLHLLVFPSVKIAQVGLMRICHLSGIIQALQEGEKSTIFRNVTFRKVL